MYISTHKAILLDTTCINRMESHLIDKHERYALKPT